MKKLVAISVLFAGLAMAVSAQWNNEWKVGFSAAFVTEMFYAASNSGKSEKTVSNEPADLYGLASDAKTETEWGKAAKGITHFFPHRRFLRPMGVGGDDRLEISFENSGENYSVWANMSADRTNPDWNGGGWDWLAHEYKLMDFFNVATMLTDWGISGTAGIFNIGIGNKPLEAAWVGTNATWGSWIGWSELNRFAIWYTAGTAAGANIHVDHFRTMKTWGNGLMIGIALADNYKLSLGYRFNPNWSTWGTSLDGDPTGNKSMSSMNGTFMVSGKPIDMLTFDLFYTINGRDDDTLARPQAAFGHNAPKASYENIIGAYVGINGIENLSVSAGYTVYFRAYEEGGFLKNDGSSTAVAYQTPLFNGVDIRLGYSGIDKIGLKWNNNFSFAEIKGTKFDAAVSSDKVVTGWTGTDALGAGEARGFFHWASILQANLGFIDGVGLEVALGNMLGVHTSLTDTTVTTTPTAAGYTQTLRTEDKTTNTSNEFRATVGAKYGVGNVNLGIALFLSVVTTTVDSDRTLTQSDSAGMTPWKTKTKVNSEDNVVKFGIPITIKVSF